MIWMAGALLLQGCVGLGAWTLGSRTESSDHPTIDRTRGVLDVRNGDPRGSIEKEGLYAEVSTGCDVDGRGFAAARVRRCRGLDAG